MREVGRTRLCYFQSYRGRRYGRCDHTAVLDPALAVGAALVADVGDAIHHQHVGQWQAAQQPDPPHEQAKRPGLGGLFLLVTTDGSRLWRFDYRRPITSKRNTLGLGTYPEVGLASARERRDAGLRRRRDL